MGNVDFSNLSLGKEIPSYELTANGLVPINSIHYFPILSENNWVATAIVSYSKFGDMNVEVSAKYVSDYAKLNSAKNLQKSNAAVRAALVFDRTNAYLYSDYGRVLAESFQEVPGRVSAANYTGTISPAAVQLSSQYPIDVKTSGSAQDSLKTINRDNENFVSLDITPIEQPTPYTCWAACIAMILNYYGTSATVSSVVSDAGVALNTYRLSGQCIDILTNIYGYSCGIEGSSNGAQYESLTLYSLRGELFILSAPIFAGFAVPGESLGHAVVIKGFTNPSSGSATMTYIDPADGYIKATTIPSNGAVTITLSGNTYDLDGAFGVYDW